MPNSYFKFKQFTVHQENCAMKVSTLACILGAYSQYQGTVNRILDIGTGTGLLALMVAQKYPEAIIDAIEIEPSAFDQAINNVGGSPWNNRINVIRDDFLNYASTFKYDLIISNPPFFENHKKTRHESINLARHVDKLTIRELMARVAGLLSSSGIFFVLLPSVEMQKAEQCAQNNGLHLCKKLNIYNFQGSPIKGNVCAFGLENSTPVHEDMIIRDHEKQYTYQFVQLLKPYYLYL